MKTTIKVDATKSLVIEPEHLSQGVNVNVTLAGFSVGGAVLTPDQCGALIFAIEQALEAQSVRVRCNGNCNQGRRCMCWVTL